MTFNVPDELNYELHDDNVKFKISDVSSNWMGTDDSFINRINPDKLNRLFIEKHLIKEINVKNTLDEGLRLLGKDNYSKAILKFDEVLYYDPDYSEALIAKSRALFGQKHFVKSLRYYKRAIKADASLEDIEYHKLLLKESNNERDHFPKLKLNIYAGDEFFTKGVFEKAVESYNRALVNPSKFKDKILSKLLNKKATALVKLGLFEDALVCFKKSSDNDYAVFGQGYCECKLGLDINDEFKELLSVDKKHQLKQAIILNKLEFFKESLKICDYLLENHFKTDEFYFKVLYLKIDSLTQLNEDASEFREIVFRLK